MEQLLTKLKKIEPPKEFSNRSKALLFSRPQAKPAPLVGLNWLNFAIGTLILILGSATALIQGNRPAGLAADSLNQEKLAQEAQSLDIQIQLSQVRYYADSAKKIEVALMETSDEYDPSGEHQKRLDELLNELTL